LWRLAGRGLRDAGTGFPDRRGDAVAGRREQIPAGDPSNGATAVFAPSHTRLLQRPGIGASAASLGGSPSDRPVEARRLCRGRPIRFGPSPTERRRGGQSLGVPLLFPQPTFRFLLTWTNYARRSRPALACSD